MRTYTVRKRIAMQEYIKLVRLTWALNKKPKEGKYFKRSKIDPDLMYPTDVYRADFATCQRIRFKNNKTQRVSLMTYRALLLSLKIKRWRRRER